MIPYVASDIVHAMAKQIIESLIDDLDETSEAAETVRFGLDGREYEIDLSDSHIDDLHEALAPYIEAGRKATGGHPHKPDHGGGKRQRGRTDREQLAAIRDWARRNGGQVKDRGRIPQRIINAYNARDASALRSDNGSTGGNEASEQPVSRSTGGR